ncbi:hypothetical protein [Cytophaga hutchinsonii]|uniref:Uncharacterized protein n=1 Tax=Cytophaga hutchinsonii (strain ATCC 33406 / DSM 1761 / CIP 103989 / NBRC 15051 / NCIMB 9469 / D465) TaxID=269798 RepID=A0A6N4SMA4_CYTH3|nr:hypothetical protein [Cytophaga hutchinsonii]ABG57395.1 hypothetical protein CHU_0102 [Cytophaga hutchinsonii ATCC 33406]SFX97382.1 hypothetical protein SAMN04487930_1162 [Cytophaga hutchinsonii ATCC 33406]
MRFVFIVMLHLNINAIATAQTDNTEDLNYKHLHNSSKHEQAAVNNSDLVEQNVTLNNQRTHKKTSRPYIVLPSDRTPETNVQGKKTKRNYKNQFN